MSASSPRAFQLDVISGLELNHLKAETVTYRGQSALRLLGNDIRGEEESIAIIPDSNFGNGTIEAEVAGSPRVDAPGFARGFVGIAFHVKPHGERFEYFFIRPSNGREGDQLRRNHSTQYCSHPDYPWYRLREESPGVYESYADLVVGEWTKIKIVVSGVHAQLYVNDAEQACLIVNDLKLGETQGQIALWVGAGTEAYFAKLSAIPA
jgi:hypothetical protein